MSRLIFGKKVAKSIHSTNSRPRCRFVCWIMPCSASPGSTQPTPSHQPHCSWPIRPATRLYTALRIIFRKSFISCGISAISRRPEMHAGLFGGGFTRSTYSTRFHCGDSVSCSTSSINALYTSTCTSMPASANISRDSPPAPTAFPRAPRSTSRKTEKGSSLDICHASPSSPRSASNSILKRSNHASYAATHPPSSSLATICEPTSPHARRNASSCLDTTGLVVSSSGCTAVSAMLPRRAVSSRQTLCIRDAASTGSAPSAAHSRTISRSAL